MINDFFLKPVKKQQGYLAGTHHHHSPILPLLSRGLRDDDVSSHQSPVQTHSGPAWRDRASPLKASLLVQFELGLR